MSKPGLKIRVRPPFCVIPMTDDALSKITLGIRSISSLETGLMYIPVML